jgi:hypothetical protein
MASLDALNNIKLSAETLRTLYRTFRAAALRAGENASAFDAWCVDRAVTRQFAEGISREVLIVDEAAGQALSAMTTRTVQISPETIEWGGFLSGTIINDTSKGEAFLAEHGWPCPH